MWQSDYGEREREGIVSVMECKRNVITMTLFRLNYLVYDLSNCAGDTTTETGLTDDVSK